MRFSQELVCALPQPMIKLNFQKSSERALRLSDRGVEMHRSCGPTEPSPGPNHSIQYQACDLMSQAKFNAWTGRAGLAREFMAEGNGCPCVLVS